MVVKIFGTKVATPRQYGRAMTCERVDAMYPDDNEISGKSNIGQTNRYFRHLMFARFVLNEPLREAWRLADAYRVTPLPVEAMHYIASTWGEDDWDGPMFGMVPSEMSEVDVLGGI